MEEVIRYEMKKLDVVYVAHDGKEFETKEQCIQHERDLKSKEPIRHWLDLRSDLGMWYYAENEEHLEIIKGQIGYYLDRYQKQLKVSGEWRTGEWYASNIEELRNFDYGGESLTIYSLTEFEREVHKSIRCLREAGSHHVSSRQ